MLRASLLAPNFNRANELFRTRLLGDLEVVISQWKALKQLPEATSSDILDIMYDSTQIIRGSIDFSKKLDPAIKADMLFNELSKYNHAGRIRDEDILSPQETILKRLTGLEYSTRTFGMISEMLQVWTPIEEEFLPTLMCVLLLGVFCKGLLSCFFFFCITSATAC